MAISNFNYFYDYLNLDTDIFKIYYNFSGFSGSNTVPSVEFGKSNYYGNSSNLGIYNGSGDLTSGGNISIANIDGNTFEGDGTHLFVYSKESNHNGYLFSSLEKNGVYPSGYAIGVNDANRMYFEYHTSGGPQIITSNNIYGQKNGVAVNVGLNGVSFNYYNFNYQEIESEEFSFDSRYLLFSDNWRLGDGSFSGHLDSYLYFNSTLSKSNLTRLFSGFYATPTGFPAVSGEKVFDKITGYNNVFSGETGVVGYDLQFSGFDSYTQNQDLNDFSDFLNNNYGGGSVGLFGITGGYLYSGGILSNFTELPSHTYGAVEIGSTGIITGLNPSGTYYIIEEFSNSYIYENGTYAETSGTAQTGIINVYLSDVEFDILTGNLNNNCHFYPVFNKIERTGYLISGYDSIPVTEKVTGYYQISAPYSGFYIDQQKVDSFGMDYISYLWDSKEDGSKEIIVLEGVTKANYTNQQASYDIIKGEFSTKEYFSPNDLNVFVNGVFQWESGYTEVANPYGSAKTKIGDFYIDNQYIVTDGFVKNSDFVIYDFNQNQIRDSILTAYDSSSGFLIGGSNIADIENKNIFINGQKLLSGIDYVISGGNFYPNNSVGDISGNLYFVNKYNGQLSYKNQYDLNQINSNGGKFARGSSMYYLNGVRLSTEFYKEHSKVDLLSGENIYNTPIDKVILFDTNNPTFPEI